MCRNVEECPRRTKGLAVLFDDSQGVRPEIESPGLNVFTRRQSLRMPPSKQLRAQAPTLRHARFDEIYVTAMDARHSQSAANLRVLPNLRPARPSPGAWASAAAAGAPPTQSRKPISAKLLFSLHKERIQGGPSH